jgi:phosphate:Na+ symporter
MQDLNSIKKNIAEMAALALKMWEGTYQTFMEHDLELLSKVLDDENKLNNFEKQIDKELVDFNRTSAKPEEKIKVAAYAEVVGDLELIGDYCKDILERVQIKIEEKLLFSEEAVKEYGQLYQKAHDAMSEVVQALERDDLCLVQEVLRHQQHIDTLVDEYRQKHTERMINGVCVPFACNMFLNMLDFTAAIYYHIKKVTRSLLSIKK